MEIKNTYVKVNSTEEKKKALQLYAALGGRLTVKPTAEEWVSAFPCSGGEYNWVRCDSGGEIAAGDGTGTAESHTRIASSVQEFQRLVDEHFKRPPEQEETQLRYNKGKLDMSLMPPEWTALICRIKHLGALKYERSNWRKGAPTSDYTASLIRHLSLWMAGEDEDDDSLESHLGHVAWNALAAWSALQKGCKDDRDKLTPDQLAQLKELLKYQPPAKYERHTK